MTEGRWEPGGNTTLEVESSAEPRSWSNRLSKMASTAERTLEMVESLRRDQAALQRTVCALEEQLSAESTLRAEQDRRVHDRIAEESGSASVAPEEFAEHRWHVLASAGRGRELVLATSAERGLRAAVLLVAGGQAQRALLLGPLEEALLLRLITERERAAEGGRPPDPLAAKVLAARIESTACGSSRLHSRPAPGTVRSAFTRLRKKLQWFAGCRTVLVGGRDGYRLSLREHSSEAGSIAQD